MASRSGLWRYALGVIDDPARSFAQREADLRAGLEMDPNWRPSRHVLALLLDNVGRIREARVEYQRLADEYPYQYEAHLWRLEAAMSAAELGRIDLARPEFESIAAAWAPSTNTTRKWFNYETWFGDPAIARRLLAEKKAGGARSKAELECVNWFLELRSGGTRPQEHEIDVTCGSGAGGDYGPEYIYGYFGYVDAALREMNARASTYLANSSPFKTNYLLFRSYMRAVRADPRFMMFMERLGQVDYWLSTDQWPDFCQTEALPYDCKEAALAAQAKAN
jgi:tetratricopeptide (TPR) repeat protein